MFVMRACLLAVVAFAACSDPTFDVAITYEQLEVDAADQLAPHVATLTVSVIDATAAGPAAGLARDATCDDVAFGRVPAAVLEGARRASVAALDTPRLSGVPRLGAKLVVAEALNASGRRVGGGCTAWGDVESDAEVAVTVEIAPRVRIFARDEVLTEPEPLQVVVTAPWSDVLPLAGRRVVAELHSASGVVEMAAEPTSPTGVTRTPSFSLDDPGPAQTLVRVRWADEPLRVPAFVLWPSMDTTSGARISLVPDESERLQRSWVSGLAQIGNQVTWGSAAIQQRAAGPEEVLIAFYNSSSRKLAAVPVTAPGVRALGIWQQRLYTVASSGWNEIGAAGLTVVPGTADGTGPASAIHVFDGCGNAPGAGLVVRRTIGTAEAFRAYTAPGVLAPPSHMLALVAGQLDSVADSIVGQVCAKLEGADVRIVLTRGSALGLVAWLSTGQRLTLTGVQGAVDFRRNDTSLLAGVEATISGPRVASYKLTNLLVGSTTLTGFVAVDGVDSEMATLPSSFAVADIDGDDLFDVIATLAGPSGPRLQANLGRIVAGQQLASISPALPGGRQATSPLIRLEDVDGQGHAELVVMTDEGLDVLCFDVKPSADGMECASAP